MNYFYNIKFLTIGISAVAISLVVLVGIYSIGYLIIGNAYDVDNRISESLYKWQTYRNEEFGISFQHPPAPWFIVEDVDLNSKVGLHRSVESYKQGLPPSLLASFYSSRGNESLLDRASQLTGNSSAEWVTTPGRPFVLATEDLGEPMYSSLYLTYLCSDTIVEIVAPQRFAESEELQQILSTIKCINNTLSWSTYTNSDYGFDFKYPSSYLVDPNHNRWQYGLPGYIGEKKVIRLNHIEVLIADSDEVKQAVSDLIEFRLSGEDYSEGDPFRLVCGQKDLDAVPHDTQAIFCTGHGGGLYFARVTGAEVDLLFVDEIGFSSYDYDQEVERFEKIFSSVNLNLLDDSWQTYRNEEYGFEFQYPSEWRVDECSADFIYFNGRCDTDASFGGSIQINPSIFNIDSEAGFIATEVGGLPANKYELETYGEGPGNPSGLRAWLITMSNRGNLFIFNFIEKSDEDFLIFDQILSTFEVIDPLDTSEWQTYRNEEFGFEIKIPEYFELMEHSSNWMYRARTADFADDLSISRTSVLDAYAFSDPGGLVCTYSSTSKSWAAQSSADNKYCPRDISTEDVTAYQINTGDGAVGVNLIFVPVEDRETFVLISLSQSWFDSCEELGVCPDIDPITDSSTLADVFETFKFVE